MSDEIRLGKQPEPTGQETGSAETGQGRIRFVLCEPSHPGNIGAAARAIHTMGFTGLDVVAPEKPNYRTHVQALSLATHSKSVLENSRCFATLAEALADADYAFAMTGYDREFGPPLAELHECAQDLPRLLAAGTGNIAFVFGCERCGMTNEEIMLCQRCAAIPANPVAQSLNLAQSVQVAAYEAQLAIREGLNRWQHRFREDPPASPVCMEKFYEHLREAMVACGALTPDDPKFLIEHMRKLFGRAEPTQHEINLLRGICAAIICPKTERAGRKGSPR